MRFFQKFLIYPVYIFIYICIYIRQTNWLTEAYSDGGQTMLHPIFSNRADPSPLFLEPMQCPHEQEKVIHRKKRNFSVNYLFTNVIAKIDNWRCNFLMTSDVRVSVPKMWQLIKCNRNNSKGTLRCVAKLSLMQYQSIDNYFEFSKSEKNVNLKNKL